MDHTVLIEGLRVRFHLSVAPCRLFLQPTLLLPLYRHRTGEFQSMTTNAMPQVLRIAVVSDTSS